VEVTPKIATLQKDQAFLLTARQECADELSTLVGAYGSNAGRIWALQRSIERIDRGWNDGVNSSNLPIDQKMRAAGYERAKDDWCLWNAMSGSLPNIESRLRELTKKRDEHGNSWTRFSESRRPSPRVSHLRRVQPVRVEASHPWLGNRSGHSHWSLRRLRFMAARRRYFSRWRSTSLGAQRGWLVHPSLGVLGRNPSVNPLVAVTSRTATDIPPT
jgi:hypothetical protein